MASNKREDTDHYQANPSGKEWVTLLRKHNGQPGEIRVDEIDEVIELLQRFKATA